MPVFILSRTRTAADVEQWPLITVLDDAAEAIARAKGAAGDRDVLVHGVGCARAALWAGVLDEVQLRLVPTILGEGRRLFEGIGAESHEFELTGTSKAAASPTSATAWSASHAKLAPSSDETLSGGRYSVSR